MPQTPGQPLEQEMTAAVRGWNQQLDRINAQENIEEDRTEILGVWERGKKECHSILVTAKSNQTEDTLI